MCWNPKCVSDDPKRTFSHIPLNSVDKSNLGSHLVQESDMARRCWGLLCVVWTVRMTAHWTAEVRPQINPLAGQWLRPQWTGAETRSTGGWPPPHPGPEDQLLQRAQVPQEFGPEGRVSGGPRRHCSAGWRGRASRRPRARFLRRGPGRLGLRGAGSALQDDETENKEEAGREAERKGREEEVYTVEWKTHQSRHGITWWEAADRNTEQV